MKILFFLFGPFPFQCPRVLSTLEGACTLPLRAVVMALPLIGRERSGRLDSSFELSASSFDCMGPLGHLSSTLPSVQP